MILPNCGAPRAVRTLLVIGVGTISEEIQDVFLVIFVPVTYMRHVGITLEEI